MYIIRCIIPTIPNMYLRNKDATKETTADAESRARESNGQMRGNIERSRRVCSG